MTVATCLNRKHSLPVIESATQVLGGRLYFFPSPALVSGGGSSYHSQSFLLQFPAILSQDAVFGGNPDRSSMANTPFSRLSLDLFAMRCVISVRSSPSLEVPFGFALW